VLDHDGVAAVDHPDRLHPDGTHGSGLDDAAGHLQTARRERALVGLTHITATIPR
jgi:hypothetical protein